METQEEKSSSVAKILGMGCLTLFLLAGLATFYVVKNIKGIGAEFVQMGAEAILDETLLPAEDKNQLKEVLDDLVDDFKNDKISQDEFAAMIDSLAEGGLIPAMGLRFFEVTYLNSVDLSEEDIEKYAQILSRYRWGIIREEINSSSQRYSEIIDIITIENGDAIEFKKSLNLDELKSCIDIMAEVAEENEIPDQYFELNLADEIRDLLVRAKEKVEKQNSEPTN